MASWDGSEYKGCILRFNFCCPDWKAASGPPGGARVHLRLGRGCLQEVQHLCVVQEVGG